MYTTQINLCISPMSGAPTFDTEKAKTGRIYNPATCTLVRHAEKTQSFGIALTGCNRELIRWNSVWPHAKFKK